MNLSVQLIGSKEWLLFPPSDSIHLYETRLPYEETTIFSSIDFNRLPVDVNAWPLFKNTSPYRVTLRPGQVSVTLSQFFIIFFKVQFVYSFFLLTILILGYQKFSPSFSRSFSYRNIGGILCVALTRHQ